jgi:hypothetical protein
LLSGTAPTPRSSIGESGWSVPATDGRSNGGERNQAAPRKSLRVGARRRVVDHIGRLIWPGYGDRSRRLLVRRRCRRVGWRLRRNTWRLGRSWLLSKGRRDWLTTKIVTRYVRRQTIGADQVSELITSVHRILRQLGQRVQPASSSKRQAGAIPTCKAAPASSWNEPSFMRPLPSARTWRFGRCSC